MASSKKATFDLFGLAVRAEPGDRVMLPSQVRDGDYLASLGGRKWLIVNTRPDAVIVKEVDRRGRPRNSRTRTFRPGSLRERQVHRISELRRPEVSFDQALNYINTRHGYPPSSIRDQGGYRTWLRENLTKSRGAPFSELGEGELEHQELLDELVDRILRERRVESDWVWTKPPAAQVGARVQLPSQLKVGDFLDYYSATYRVTGVQDDYVTVVPVGPSGAPTGAHRRFDTSFLQDYRVTRAAPLQRADVTYQEALTWADAELAQPPPEVTSFAQYRAWLMDQFKNLAGSPYQRLGPDEVEHQNALVKQIRRLLDERGVGPAWDG